MFCSEKTDSRIYTNYLHGYMKQNMTVSSISTQMGKKLDLEIFEFVKKNKILFVTFDCNIEDQLISSVELNYPFGVYEVATRFINQGYREIVYLMPNRETLQGTKRLIEIQSAISERENVSLNLIKIDMGVSAL